MPIGKIGDATLILVANPNVPAKSLQELIALSKKTPGGLSYGTSGTGSTPHIAGELFKIRSGAQLTHVPYKGGPPAFTDLVGGRIPAMVSGMQGALPQIKAEKIRALAVTGMRRSPALPDVPTVNEALGLRDYEALNWQSLLFPAGTPKPVVDRVATEVIKILAQADVRERLLQMGYEPIGNRPEQFASAALADQKRWSAIIQAANITSD